MKEKNKMEFGEVEENIRLTIEYDVHERNQSLLTEGKVRKTVSFCKEPFSNGNGMSIAALLDFQEKANELLALVKQLLAEGTCVEVSLVKSAYEHVPEYEITNDFGTHKSTINQVRFECWEFKDNCLDGDPDEEGAGLYLRPDTKYTDETWDIVLYWNQDILKSLAEAHL